MPDHGKPQLNDNIRRLICSYSGQEVDANGFRRPIGLCSCCPAPGKPVVVEYALEKVNAELEARGGIARAEPGLEAFAPLLPVRGLSPSFAGDVGRTSVAKSEPLSAEHDVDVLIKNEGTNPSGSFKDRGLAIAVALGTACGARRFCLPTQGNAGVAASLFSARLGLEGCVVYMPEGYQDGIYHREAAFFGAEIKFSGTNIAASGKQMREDYADQLSSGDLVDVSTFFEPGRLEGKKTMGLEIFDHFGPDGLPDWIIYPTGGGTGLVGIWKALRELQELGFVDPKRHRLPKLVAVQSEQCAPVIRAFERDLDEVEPVQSQGTIADGLDVPGAIMGHAILSSIRESQGSAVAVSEEAIVKAFNTCGRLGLPVSYECGAVLAALENLKRSAQIVPGESVLLLMTASHLVPLGQADNAVG
ncbi:MAG: pyridoxal-phosphate dependent enzyme [bacterium]|nr:pyridoxal-phosphate dependent enzyme [bacterium]